MLVDKLVVRQESLLNPGTAGFDKEPSAQADVSTEIGRDPGELVAIANGGTDRHDAQWLGDDGAWSSPWRSSPNNQPSVALSNHRQQTGDAKSAPPA
jgi:hypothetical protein